MSLKALVLDAPGGALVDVTRALRSATGPDCTVEVVNSFSALLERIAQSAFDVVVIDYLLGDGTRAGGEILAGVRARTPEAAVIAVAERGDVELAGEAVRAGATDFLVRGGDLPQRVSTLLGKIRRLLDVVDRHRVLSLECQRLRLADARRYRIVAQSAAMRAVLEQTRRVAKIPRPVLIVGERGTGKELIARAIHEASGRGDEPFVAVNCAAIPEHLLESELFGHEKGAFTGAERRVRGRFEQADGGTLFLDEVGAMPLAFQQKLLRVAEYGTFTRVGGTEELRTTARVLAATNTDLETAMVEGRFLRDLYDRLAFENVRIPPLREREGDLAVLAQYFLDEFLREIPALGSKRLSRSTLELLRQYAFPGNVRELKTIIERAAYRDRTSEITPEDVGPLPGAEAEAGDGFEARVEAFRRELVLDALEKAGGRQTRAAELLGLPYHRYRYYHRKYAAARDSRKDGVRRRKPPPPGSRTKS